MRGGGRGAKKIIGLTDCDDLSSDVSAVFSQCQQAYHRQILVGDLNRVQIVALDIAKRLERMRYLVDNRDDRDFWLSYEHPKAYMRAIEEREMLKQQEQADVSISADTMEELIRLMDEQGV